MSDQNVLRRLKQTHADLAKLMASLSDAQFLTPMHGWSPRDVVAHLIGWNGLMIDSSLSILAGKAPSYYQDSKNDYSNVNAEFTKKFSSRSKPELLAQLKSSIEKLEAFVLALSPEELRADHGVAHYSGVPATIEKIINSLASDYQYHTDQIIEWLNKKAAKN
ncbi:MAG TPA: ClbS/DfsB family four-helix bundle protein [Anaerolineales bacterium]|nr:ClbS/DfsB family four-helix bundle protein [Anaerolineales bacterium]